MIDSTNSELALIGALFIMADQKPITELYRYVVQVEESDFNDQKCATVYRYIKKSVVEEKAFDVASIDSDISQSKVAGVRPSFGDIGGMVMAQSGYAAIESHISVIKSASLQRSALAALSGVYESLQSSENILQALGNVESTIESLMMKAHGESSGLTHITSLIANWVETANEQYMGKESEKGCTTGFDGADEMLGEELLKPGTLVVVGANPGKGKTQIMIRMAEAIALQYKDRTCQVYSLEMPSYQIADRFMGLATGNKKAKHFNDPDWGLISNHIERLSSTNLFVSDDPVISVEMIKMNARSVISQGGRISAIFVDYLTLMKMPKADRRDLSVGEVTIQCKRLAKELGCVVVLLAQLSRSNMQRTNKRPINSDLRDSGQIEQDADYIFFPYYDFYFNPDSDCGPFAEIICSKNRHGKAETTYAKVLNGVWYSCERNEALARLMGG